MLLLPSAALRRSPLPEPEPDEPITSPAAAPPAMVERGASTESGACGSGSRGSPLKRRPSLVRRSKFFMEHESGAMLDNVYEVEPKPLGEGGFGTVWRAHMRGADKVVRAVKAVRKKSAATDVMVQEEVSILRSLDHPYICRVFETFDGPKFTYLVMELVDGQELFDYIQQASVANLLSEDFAARIMWQVFSALQYCHGLSVVHRDLKPENIMVQRVSAHGSVAQLEIKLIDFGLAACWTRASRPASGSLVGTCCYSAPEARFGDSANPSSDMWSAGMVLHTLLVGGLPEEDPSVGAGQLALAGPAYAGVSPGAKELMAGLLRTDPRQRLTAAEAGSCAWLRGEARAVASPERIANTMSAFTSFYRSNMLRRAVLTALAMQLADQQIADLHEQFLLMDADGNGRISRAELAKSVEHACPGEYEDVASWVESVFDSVDTDGSDEIEYTEWLAAAHHEGEVRSDQAIHAAFRVFDLDCSGKISVNEIARITSDTPADVANFLPEYDANGDGEIDFQEFRDLILRAPPLLSPAISCDSLQVKQPRPMSAPVSAVSRVLRATMARRSSTGCLGPENPSAGGDAARGALWQSQAHPVPSTMIVSV